MLSKSVLFQINQIKNWSPVTHLLGRLREKDYKLEASLSTSAKLSQKKIKRAGISREQLPSKYKVLGLIPQYHK